MLRREKGEVEWRAGESGWDEGKGSHAFGYPIHFERLHLSPAYLLQPPNTVLWTRNLPAKPCAVTLKSYWEVSTEGERRLLRAGPSHHPGTA